MTESWRKEWRKVLDGLDFWRSVIYVILQFLRVRPPALVIYLGRLTFKSVPTATSSPREPRSFSFPRVFTTKSSLIEVSWQKKRVSFRLGPVTTCLTCRRPSRDSPPTSLTGRHRCCYLSLMSASIPPPLCDISTDPNHKHPKANPIPNILIYIILISQYSLLSRFQRGHFLPARMVGHSK